MTIRLDMLAAVRRAPDVLGASIEVVKGFLRRQFTEDGGFRGRDERSDLYYSVFGLEACLALGVEIPCERAAEYLAGFARGETLDLVHLASLIRCRANMANPWDRETVVKRLLEFRSQDGGFNTTAADEHGSAYGSFLALGALQDLGVNYLDAEAMGQSIASLQRPDGGYANEPAMQASATPATAAALCVLHYLQRPVPESAVQWLQARAHPLGGFTAIAFGRAGGVPDLLSTATALHALALVGDRPAAETRDRHLDYLDSLWNADGGFRGHWADEIVDCEYTYYGLLALGTLAE